MKTRLFYFLYWKYKKTQRALSLVQSGMIYGFIKKTNPWKFTLPPPHRDKYISISSHYKTNEISNIGSLELICSFMNTEELVNWFGGSGVLSEMYSYYFPEMHRKRSSSMCFWYQSKAAATPVRKNTSNWLGDI